MKTLLINGSPRPEGNTAALIRELKQYLKGEIIEISAFYSNIAPCVDCRGCWETAQCVVHDEMDLIYRDDFDNVVIASPVYYGTLPGSVLSLISRMQPWHVATHFLKEPLVQKPKKSAVILTAGGKGNEERVLIHGNCFFRMVNASRYQDHIACSPNTDTIPAEQDETAKAQVREIALWLNSQEPVQKCGFQKDRGK